MLSSAAIDADAFIAMRGLGLVAELDRIHREHGFQAHITGYVARSELSSLAPALDALIASGILQEHKVVKGTPEFVRFRSYVKGRAADKGESELVAWLVERQPKPRALLSCDRQARGFAIGEGCAALDVAELVAEWILGGALTKERAAALLRPWEDGGAGYCCPRAFAGVDAMVKAWAERRVRLGLM